MNKHFIIKIKLKCLNGSLNKVTNKQSNALIMQHITDTTYDECTIAIYEDHIDFDESSTSWRQNKKYVGNGMYKYICPCFTKKGNKCGKVTWKNEECCYIHQTTLLQSSLNKRF